MLDLTTQSVQISVWENTVGVFFVVMFEDKLYQFLSVRGTYLTHAYSHMNSGLVV